MEFGINKCGILVMKRGRCEKSESYILLDEPEINEIDVEMDIFVNNRSG